MVIRSVVREVRRERIVEIEVLLVVGKARKTWKARKTRKANYGRDSDTNRWCEARTNNKNQSMRVPLYTGCFVVDSKTVSARRAGRHQDASTRIKAIGYRVGETRIGKRSKRKVQVFGDVTLKCCSAWWACRMKALNAANGHKGHLNWGGSHLCFK